MTIFILYYLVLKTYMEKQEEKLRVDISTKILFEEFCQNLMFSILGELVSLKDSFS